MRVGMLLFQVHEDSLTGSVDSMTVTGQNKVFATVKDQPDSLNTHFPLSENIHRNLTPDWILYILIGVFALLAWIRMVYNKYLVNLFEASFNYLRAVQVNNDPGIVQKRIFLLFNLVYIISGGLYMYQIFDHYSIYPGGIEGFRLFLISTAFLTGLMLFRVIILKLTAVIFNRTKLFNEYLFHQFLFNKINGIVLLPFILGIAYTKGIAVSIIIYLSYTAIAAVLVLRVTRLLIFIFKNVVLLFYMILYLCTLEILPVLVIVKLILSLA
jgi:hypothetical protein